MTLRSPIVSVLGHVDHGKSSVLDAIRGSNIISKEPGAITQAIGASIVPLEVIKKVCGSMLEQIKMDFTIPGLLFIDTPGHAAFTSLRKRGGSLADIAVVVIDIKEGFKPQSIEAVEILKQSKTPFIIVANKIDLLPGYRKHHDHFLQDLNKQDEIVRQLIDTRIYELVGQLHEHFGMQSDRFDRVDYTKQVAIVPASAKQHVGLAEMLMVLTGMAQRYFNDNLKLQVKGPGRGTILEVKEEKGLGVTLDVIIYDGTLNVNDTIVIGGVNRAISTRIRALLLPDPLGEMRDKRTTFRSVKSVIAATGVKISAPDIKDVISGMPLIACRPEETEAVKQTIMQDVKDIMIDTDKDGIILKADTLGSLEALILMCREKKIPVQKARVGPVAKKDIMDAEANYDRDPETAAILGFNIPQVASTSRAKVITHDVIYTLLDGYEAWIKTVQTQQEAKELTNLVRPAKVEVLKNCIFRQKSPCIIGVEVLAGTLRTTVELMKDGTVVGSVKSIQSENKSVNEIDTGKQVAIAIPQACAGKSIEEGDILYVNVPEVDFRKLKGLKQFLDDKEKQVLRELAEMHRADNVVWGV